MYHGPGKWSGRAVSRQLGVSHTYIQKLLREYAADPSRMLREQRLFRPATLDALRRAREETQKRRERGWLRRPRLWKTMEFKIGDNVLRDVVPTKASARAVAADNAVPPDAPAWAAPTWPTRRITPIRVRRRRIGRGTPW